MSTDDGSGVYDRKDIYGACVEASESCKRVDY